MKILLVFYKCSRLELLGTTSIRGGDTSMQRVVIYLWREGTSCFMYHRVIRDGTFAAFLLKKGAIVRRLYPIFAETLFLENQKCQLCGVQQITKVMAIIHASSSIQINISVWTKAVNQLFSRFRSFHSGPAKRDYGNSLGLVTSCFILLVSSSCFVTTLHFLSLSLFSIFLCLNLCLILHSCAPQIGPTSWVRK